jgi:tetratricopeptide (TPR) repeat protein
MNWKELHEQAVKLTLSDALEMVKQLPGSIDDMYVLGLIYLNLHKDKEAGYIFNKIITLNPESPEAKWGIAEVLRRQHNLIKSEELLNEVIKANPEFSPAYISLAYIRYIQTRFEESVALAHRIIDRGSNSVDESNFVRAYLLMGGGKGMIAHYGGPLSKAINGTAVMPNLKKAEKLQPNSAAVAFGIGSFYLLAPTIAGGDLDKAERYLERTIEIDPLFTDAYVRIAQLYKFKGDNEKYKSYLDKALEIDPQNEIALDIKSGKCKFVCNR